LDLKDYQWFHSLDAAGPFSFDLAALPGSRSVIGQMFGQNKALNF
jgi:hypothetical protein